MNIKITERPGGTWSLWVTEGTGDTEPPIYTATNRTKAQMEALLPVIFAEVPEAPEAARMRLERDDTPTTNRKTGAHNALAAVLGALDGWIQGARENHQALSHRAEPVGSECWRQFEPSDIRAMVNDAAREMGLAEFPAPDRAREDQPWA